jgi:hypothetical protein
MSVIRRREGVDQDIADLAEYLLNRSICCISIC